MLQHCLRVLAFSLQQQSLLQDHMRCRLWSYLFSTCRARVCIILSQLSLFKALRSNAHLLHAAQWMVRLQHIIGALDIMLDRARPHGVHDSSNQLAMLKSFTATSALAVVISGGCPLLFRHF